MSAIMQPCAAWLGMKASLPEVRISDRGLRFGVMADALPGVLID